MGLLSSFASTKNVQVYALATGWAHLPDKWIWQDGDDDIVKARQRLPAYSFLVRHPSGKNILFDAGLPKNLDVIPPATRSINHIFEPYVPKDARDLLAEGPVPPDSLSAIILSHIHFDHVGDPSLFPDVPYIAGPGTKAAALPGYPVDPNSPVLSSLLTRDNYTELSRTEDAWTSLGPFPHAHDFFGDGSFYIVDTPGHLPGHITGLAQTGPDEWVLMGGDCCHARSVLDGSRPLSLDGCPGGTSMHVDVDEAITSIERLRKLDQDDTVFVALAHDATLEGKMPEYPTALNGWRESAWWASMKSEREKTRVRPAA
ncbi:Metallo-hydrolase/oxidoreductase [Trichoderma longibrachiatum ATCC 18648]|uniref:Metallo-hydrolase/oxidoreductase n=1 Tax=Trichoderma longibrachiatum ATCC 18648 TaxID=983965 RepID=A0A2T4C0P3_TRILO|nr:Metallo-hydrolase/oxidoreductase [Trichoderma longibrachiatum ATCC 18648]